MIPFQLWVIEMKPYNLVLIKLTLVPSIDFLTVYLRSLLSWTLLSYPFIFRSSVIVSVYLHFGICLFGIAVTLEFIHFLDVQFRKSFYVLISTQNCYFVGKSVLYICQRNSLLLDRSSLVNQDLFLDWIVSFIAEVNIASFTQNLNIFICLSLYLP